MNKLKITNLSSFVRRIRADSEFAIRFQSKSYPERPIEGYLLAASFARLAGVAPDLVRPLLILRSYTSRRCDRIH